ncbi:MAG: hypothetical protein GEV00_12205 [Actinophytocola sp.]|nr:hypothetical protein [Actinophytocola sp.]
MTTLRCGNAVFEWIGDWASPPPDVHDGAGWAHHGVAVTADQRVVTFQSGGDSVCVFDQDGRLVDSWPTGLVEAHEMAISGPPGEQRLWIADPGIKCVPNGAGAYDVHRPHTHGRVRSFTLDGEKSDELPTPDHAAYESKPYAPTAVAVAPDGSIWVADGYGQSLVHRFSPEGKLELTLSGEEGAGRFACPHYVFIDHRQSRPRVYVADRGNSRLQIYDTDGAFLNTVSDGLNSPSAMTTFGDQLFIAELQARVTVLDADDTVACYLGHDEEAPQRNGWPNAVTDDEHTTRPDALKPGMFNSPHGIAADERGDLYVVEWLIGGRITRLRRAS